MLTTTELQLFAQTADRGSLTKAAQALGLLPATASASLKRMERELGVRLFERSTRSMRLTAEGEAFLQHCRTALDALESGIAGLRAGKGSIGGTLRISAPADFGRNVLISWLNDFQRMHPGVQVVVQCSDRFIDVIRDPYDLAFRYGRLDDSSLVAQRFGANRRVVVAAPAYLARHGTPRSLADLAGHNCLLHNLTPHGTNTWRFTRGRKALEVAVRGDRMSDDGGIVREWAVAGEGIAYKSELDVRADLEAGRLLRLFPELTGEDWQLSAVYPHRTSLSPAASALIAFVKARIPTGTGS